MEVMIQEFQYVRNALINALHVVQQQATVWLVAQSLKGNYRVQIVLAY